MSAVAGRSRRSVEFEKKQRRYDLSPHGDRRLLESGLVGSYEEQVRSVVGSSADVEDANVAILHETPDMVIHRRPSGLGAIVQHPPPQHRYGAVTGKCTESRKGVAAPVRSRR